MILKKEDEYDATTIEKRARHLRTLLGHFWARWKNEYLLSLREFHRLKSTNQKEAEVQEGAVVLVRESGASRNPWKLAVVEQLITSGDNEVRGATVRVVNGRGRLSRINRPLKTLYPLEVMQQKEQGKSFPSSSYFDEEQCTAQREERRPRRKATMNADAIRRFIDQ